MQISVVTALIVSVLVGGVACSRIKDQFPDKEKDYQFASQIPPLQLPPDLNTKAINFNPDVTAPVNSRSSAPGYAAQAQNQAQQPVSEGPKYIPVELVDYDGGATRLRIEEPIARAWRYVGKALTRNSIEIVARNEERYSYDVQYDPDAEKLEDGALWDELVFFFGDDPAQEKKLRIMMQSKNELLTDVIVLDRNDKPLSKGAGLHLLKLLKNTINEDLANKAQDASDESE